MEDVKEVASDEFARESRPAREEYPERISISADPQSEGAAIDSVLPEAELPAGALRAPNILYLPSYPVSQRDEALGRYMAAFSRLELQLFLVMKAALQAPMPMVQSVFSLGLNINNIEDLIMSNAGNVVDKDGYSELSTWLASYRKRNQRRNALVHASWLLEVEIGTGTNSEPIVTNWRWIRAHEPSKLATRAAIARNEASALSKHSFSVEDIEQATEHVDALTARSKNLSILRNSS